MVSLADKLSEDYFKINERDRQTDTQSINLTKPLTGTQLETTEKAAFW